MSRETFELQYKDVAERTAKRLGTSPTTLLAQWGLETGWGKSIVPGTNNLGNIKDFSGKGVSAVDNATGSNDRYKKFATVDEFSDAYASLIERRYPKAVGQTTATGFATALKAGGYAEDEQYVSKIAALAGETAPAPSAKPTVATLRDTQERALRRVFDASLMPASNPVSREAGLQRENQRTREDIADDPTGLEMAGAALAGNTSNSIFNSLFRPRFEAEPGYVPDYSAVPQGADSDLLHRIAGSKSAGETQQAIQAYEDEQLRMQTLMSRGTAVGVLGALGGEIVDPINWVAPFAAAKGLAVVGKGSEVLMAAGRTGAGYASAVGENLLSGTAIEAVKQSLQGEFKPVDLGISLVADALIGIGSGALTAHHASNILTNKAVDAALIREVALAERAAAKLGPDATVQEIQEAMKAEAKAELNTRITASVATVPAERRLIDEVAEAPAELNQFNEAATSQFFSASNEARVGREMTSDQRFTEMADLGLFKHAEDYPERKLQLDNLNTTPGVHLADNIKDDGVYKHHAKVLEALRKQLIPEVALHYTDGGTGLGSNTGVAGVVKPGVSMIAVKPGGGLRAALHEFAHVVFAHRLSKADAAQQAAMVADWKKWKESLLNEPGKAQEAMLKRSPVAATGDASGTAIYNEALGGKWKHSLADVFGLVFTDRADKAKFVDYFSNFNEYSAEQLLKYMEAKSLDNAAGELSLPEAVVRMFKALLQSALDVFKAAKDKKVLAPDASFTKFFDDLVVGNREAGLLPTDADGELQAMAVPAKPAAVVNEIMTDPDAVRFGLSQAPVGTAAERKQVQAMIALHKKAEAWEKANPMDEKWVARAQSLADNNVFNVSSIGLTMLKSPSPLVRMLASELVEDASGVAGKRHNTAAISKYLLERQMTGNAINDVQGAYDLWKVTQPGGGLKDDLLGGRVWHSWNQTLAAEIEARRLTKAPVNPDANVKAAVDSIEAAYQRIADAQRKVNTLGSEGLPASSVGYMPHRMSPSAVMRLTNEQLQVVHSELVDQFITIEGWDASFSDQLAATYLQRVRSRAAGDYGSNVGGAAAASIVEEALRKMDLPEDTIKAHMDKFNKGAAGYTKGRIALDLNRVHSTPDGDFRLLDVFETDQIELLRSQAGAASGDVALTQHGVRGKPGAQLLRQAMQYGENGKRAGMKEFEAFDQMMAEFRNEPFGTHGGKWLDRAMQANTLVRLGGIAFNQLAETLNGIAHIGAIRTAESVTSIPRLRGEILALAKGQKVDNPIIGSIELAGGAEFGTDAYKFVMPFDSPNHAFPTYGQDTLTVTDRLLRGGGHLQAKLSGWRAIHSAQQRGMAEQIVHKMMRYVRDGSDDVALEQFGINAQVRAALLNDMNAVTKWNGDRLVEFDVTKIADAEIREQVIQAVWRGTSQIIQGTYIGERGKWAHDGLLKLMTQFRTFGITSMEKQWGRQRNSRGAYSAFGLLVGSMAMATPIYMARVYANSVGRPDQEQYINERLEPQAIARATLNYVASAGMASDFIDLTSSVLPESWGIKPTGGRSGVESDFVGNYIAPASSLVNDIWKYAQSPLELDDAAKIMPMRNVPYLVPLMNLTRD